MCFIENFILLKETPRDTKEFSIKSTRSAKCRCCLAISASNSEPVRKACDLQVTCGRQGEIAVNVVAGGLTLVVDLIGDALAVLVFFGARTA